MDNGNSNYVNTLPEVTTYDELIKSGFCMMFFRTGCKEKRHGRGLCAHHYHLFKYRVKRGYITWEKLEAQCRCIPAAGDEFNKLMKD